jgi:hypothetical protein
VKNGLSNGHPCERFVIEIDGIAKSEYRIFVKALQAGLRLRRQFPTSTIKLREINEESLFASHQRPWKGRPNRPCEK